MKRSGWDNPETLAKVWRLYCDGAIRSEMAHMLDINFGVMDDAITRARETVGVQEAMDRFGIVGTPRKPVRM